jgi:3-deoxy-manno-octulosonate cytidylyltransferase (CMP-KDO synthetase)
MNEIPSVLAADERGALGCALGVIPARYASTRFPGKPLANILGKYMIQRVWEAAREARHIRRLVIATDDERIAEVCRNFGAEVLHTPCSLPSGADRVAYASRFYAREEGETYPVILNIQGDEPLLSGALLDELVAAFLARNTPADVENLWNINTRLVVTTPVQRIVSTEELFSPHCVKAALDASGRILYFSRSPLPCPAAFSSAASALEAHIFWKHIGLYAYSAAALAAFADAPPSALEQCEQLEQLRLLERGAEFYAVPTSERLIAVDVESDIERVCSEFLQKKKVAFHKFYYYLAQS